MESPAQASSSSIDPQAPTETPQTEPEHPTRPPEPEQPTPPQESAPVSQPDRSGLQSSKEDVWYLKEVTFTAGGQPRRYKIITQNFNGPCSFIAICNILILRDDIQILPPNRVTVSYEFLAQLVAEYLLMHSPNVDISAALSMMPLTTKGMDLNPLFTGPTSFRPATTGGELELFTHAGITLVHGWLVDPGTPEFDAVSRVQDYDTAVNLIVEADVITRGKLVDNQESNGVGSSSSAGPASPILNDEDRKKVEDALAVRSFLDTTRSQLTYHGLFTLASLSVPPTTPSDLSDTSTGPPTLLALFRNSHLSVLYKHPTGALYSLVTDHVFLHEPSVVWERLEDVDQGAAVFVDCEFALSTPVGGDWAGWSPGQEEGQGGVVDPSDQALAIKLQEQEDAYAQQLYAQREEERRQQRMHQEREEQLREAASMAKKKQSKDCIIM
ncbi:hypothetical protein BV25DRAFT_1822712 [Artomyces pyxidatus]|uniref:Uncharacterized protein n=1 Tax=Artomyces pyxidatus TaxID=48021 RepID=A0ACB8T8Q0_9AGAM|nr:hypothetical protein BV25DRAFT_1822712 [Artomyces pyxidatus]